MTEIIWNLSIETLKSEGNKISNKRKPNPGHVDHLTPYGIGIFWTLYGLRSPSNMSSHNQNLTTTSAPDNMGTASNATFGLTGLLVFVIVVILIIFAKKRCINRRRRRKHSDSAADEEGSSFNERNEMFVKDPFKDLEEKTSERWGQLPDNVKWLLKGHIIDYRKVRLGGVIGKGLTTD